MKKYAFLLLSFPIILFFACSDDSVLPDPQDSDPFGTDSTATDSTIVDTITNSFVHPVQSIEGEPKEWNWFDIDGMICRDSSETGIAVRLGNESSKWVIFLQGGGACFVAQNCATNSSSYTEDNLNNAVSNHGFMYEGILNTDKEENIVKDWNFIFIPYCTGDVHSGSKLNGQAVDVPGVQRFVGNNNVDLVLEYMKPYFDHHNIDEMVITGTSAGGFGAHLTYYDFKELYPNLKTYLINDSGPLLSDRAVFPNCLQIGFTLVFGIEYPQDLWNCCSPSYGLADVYTYGTDLYPDDKFALVSFTEDPVIRNHFSAGQNNCTGGPISADAYRESLSHLRDNVLDPTGKISTFYTPGEKHGFITNNEKYYNLEEDGYSVAEWMTSIMSGEVIHVGE